MWYLAAKAKILVSQYFANLHRIKFPLHSIFFQNNSFFMGNKMDTELKQSVNEAASNLIKVAQVAQK